MGKGLPGRTKNTFVEIMRRRLQSDACRNRVHIRREKKKPWSGPTDATVTSVETKGAEGKRQLDRACFFIAAQSCKEGGPGPPLGHLWGEEEGEMTGERGGSNGRGNWVRVGGGGKRKERVGERARRPAFGDSSRAGKFWRGSAVYYALPCLNRVEGKNQFSGGGVRGDE